MLLQDRECNILGIRTHKNTHNYMHLFMFPCLCVYMEHPLSKYYLRHSRRIVIKSHSVFEIFIRVAHIMILIAVCILMYCLNHNNILLHNVLSFGS